jgi:hypothetical protein
VRLDVKLGCDLANEPPAAADAFRASADRLFAGVLAQVKELAAAYADWCIAAAATRIDDECRSPFSSLTIAD